MRSHLTELFICCDRIEFEIVTAILDSPSIQGSVNVLHNCAKRASSVTEVGIIINETDIALISKLKIEAIERVNN